MWLVGIWLRAIVHHSILKSFASVVIIAYSLTSIYGVVVIHFVIQMAIYCAALFNSLVIVWVSNLDIHIPQIRVPRRHTYVKELSFGRVRQRPLSYNRIDQAH